MVQGMRRFLYYWQNLLKSLDRIMVVNLSYEVWRLFHLLPQFDFRIYRPPTIIETTTIAQ
jgi:hypothetical protein